jgi:trk system potassium uptake protein
MKKQIVVVGLGRLGASIATTLAGIGHEVLAVDDNAERVQDITPAVTHAVQADPTSESALRELGVRNFDIGIVTSPEIETSVLSTILLKKVGVPFIIARAVDDLHETILSKIGADKVFNPEREMGAGIAYVLTLGDVIDYIPVTTDYGVVKLVIPGYFIGKTLFELGFGMHGKWEVAVLLLERKNSVRIDPDMNQVLEKADILVVSGEWDRLNALFSEVQKSAKAG